MSTPVDNLLVTLGRAGPAGRGGTGRHTPETLIGHFRAVFPVSHGRFRPVFGLIYGWRPARFVPGRGSALPLLSEPLNWLGFGLTGGNPGSTASRGFQALAFWGAGERGRPACFPPFRSCRFGASHACPAPSPARQVRMCCYGRPLCPRAQKNRPGPVLCGKN